MITAFGKELRMLRLEKNEILKDMADKLEIAPSYLSSIENGKKPITKSFLNELFAKYDLDNNQIIKLENAVQITQNEIKMNLEGVKETNIPTALKFARSLGNLSDDAIVRINKILKEFEKGNEDDQ